MELEELQKEIKKLGTKNKMSNYVIGGVALLGGLTGILVAHKMGFKFLGKAGFFLLGAVVTGVPTKFIVKSGVDERNAKIVTLNSELIMKSLEKVKKDFELANPKK
jgi:hypothetical protein